MIVRRKSKGKDNHNRIAKLRSYAWWYAEELRLKEVKRTKSWSKLRWHNRIVWANFRGKQLSRKIKKAMKNNE